MNRVLIFRINRRVTLFSLILLLTTLLLTTACDGDSTQVVTGQSAPSFSLTQLHGGTTRFPDDFRGQVVAIRFWADWCPYCKDEMTAIEPLYRQYREKGLRILAVNVRQSADTAAAFVKKLNISYDVLLDKEGEVARAYGVVGLPTTIFVGRDGTIKSRIIGESTTEVFDRVLTDLLKDSP